LKFVVGSGTGGKLLAWHLASNQGTRLPSWSGGGLAGSCPNIACMPSKNEISSAKVAHFARQGGDYGTVTGSVTVNTAPSDIV
jgi:pyruvate/2-oxoglutarate dehydrogenase complex dihydrolipoamide dehydrogenase (E3) component